MDFKISDLRVDTFSPGANTGWGMLPQTAIRITHVPTGIYVEEKGERSQHRNRAEALRKLEVVFALLPECVDRKEEETRNSIIDEVILALIDRASPSDEMFLSSAIEAVEALKTKFTKE